MSALATVPDTVPATAPDVTATAPGRGRRLAALLAAVPVAVWIVAALRVAAQLVTAGRYGIFRDELYYLSCADHLGWGYVDHPPLSIAVLALWRSVFGESVMALRVVPALAGGVLVVATALLARRLGGGTAAQVLAAVAVTVAPVGLTLTGFYSMNALDLLFWIAAAHVALTIGGDDRPRAWLVFGAVVGLGALNKISIGFLAVAVAVAVLATPLRRHLRTPWPWLGALLAALLFLPHVLWQVAHDWPTAEFVRNARAYKIADLGVLGRLREVVLQNHPLNVFLWLPGLAWLLAARRHRGHRLLGIAATLVLVYLLASQSKPYYLAPLVPILLAAGAVAVDALARRLSAPWSTALVTAVVAVGGVVTAPLAVPVLAPDDFAAYQRRLGLVPAAEENHAMGVLPQHYADRFGWEELAATTAAAWHALPPAERATTLLVAGNYGEAGALRYYRERYDLPPALSQHNSHYLWGLEPTGGIDLAAVTGVLAVGIGRADLAEAFADVRLAGRVDHPLAMPYETGEMVWIARRPTVPLADAWAAGKSFN